QDPPKPPGSAALSVCAGSRRSVMDQTNVPPPISSGHDWFEPPTSAFPPGMDPPPAPPALFPVEETFVFGSGRGGGGFGRIALTILLILALTAGGVVFWFSRSGGGGVALALEMPRGQSIGYLMNVTMQGTVSGEGQSEQVSASVSARAAWKVQSVDADGVSTVELRIWK